VPIIQEIWEQTRKGLKKGHKDEQRAREPACEERLKELGHFPLEKRSLRETSSHYSST